MPGGAELMRYYAASSTIASSPQAVWADGAASPSFDRFARGLKHLVEAGR
jgi:hypothetical protein